MKKRSFLLSGLMLVCAMASLSSCGDKDKVKPDNSSTEQEKPVDNGGQQGDNGEKPVDNGGQQGENNDEKKEEKVTLNVNAFDALAKTQIGEALSFEVKKGSLLKDFTLGEFDDYTLVQSFSDENGALIDENTELNENKTFNVYFVKNVYNLAEENGLATYTGYTLASDGTILLDKGLNEETYNIKLANIPAGKYKFKITYKAKNTKINEGTTASVRIRYNSNDLVGANLTSEELGPITSEYEIVAFNENNDLFIGRVGGTGVIITSIELSYEKVDTKKVAVFAEDNSFEEDLFLGADLYQSLASHNKAGYQTKLFSDDTFTTEIEKGTKVTENLEKVFVKYELIDYTISFMNDEVEAKTSTLHYGDSVELPEAPVKDGFRFAGWEDKNGNIVDFTNYTVTSTQTFKAKFVEIVNVTLVVDGTLDVRTIDKGSNLELAEQPTKEGYKFLGWYVGDDEFNFNQINDSVTVTAKFEIITFSIKLSLEGSTLPDGFELNDTINYGVEFELPTPVKTGFDFKGWNDSEGNLHQAGEKLINTDIDLVAVFEEQAGVTYFDVKFVTNSDDTLDDLRIAEGETFTLPTLERKGFEFDGWYTDSEFKDKYVESKVESGLTLYAKWIQLYNVTFYDGDTLLENLTISDVKSGYIVSKPDALEKENSEFEGWFIDKELTTPFNFEEGIKGDLTIYAKWKFVVTFEGIEEKQFVATNNKANEPKEVPTKEGSKFVGWIGLDNEITADTLIKAEWEVVFVKHTLTVTGSTLNNDGFFTPSSSNLEGNKNTIKFGGKDGSVSFTVSEKTPLVQIIVKGYASGSTAAGIELFVGKENQSSVIATPQLAKDTDKDSEKINYTAEIEGDVTFTLKRNGGQFNASSIEVIEYVYCPIVTTIVDGNPIDNLVGYGQKLNISDPAKEHYIFSGWFTDEELKNPYVLTPVYEPITLYGTFNKEIYEVTFNANGGTFDENASIVQKVEYEGLLEEQDKPSRYGYEFIGWTLENDSNLYDLTTPITDKLSLFAAWNAKNVVVTLYANDPDAKILGEDSVKLTAKFDSSVNSIQEYAEPIHTSKTFLYWTTDPEGKTIYDIESNIISEDELVLYAQYSNEAPVTFLVDDEEVAKQTVKIGECAQNIESPSKTGYTFEFWCTDLSNPEKYDFETPISGVTELHAYFTINKYQVVFNANDGKFADDSTEAIQNVNYKSFISEQEVPTQEGYEFVGWFTKEGVEYSTTLGEVTDDLYLYARWTDVAVISSKNNINADFKTTKFDDNTVASFKSSSKNIIVKDSLGNDFVFTAVADSKNGVSIDSSNGFKFKNTAAGLVFTVKNSCTIEITLKIGSDGRGIVMKNGDVKYFSIISGGSDDTNVEFDAADAIGTEYTKKKNESRVVKITNCQPGTYTINTIATQDVYIKSINILEDVNTAKQVSSLSATTSLDEENKLVVSDVTLGFVGTIDKLVLTDGYEILVDDASYDNQVLSQGEHKVTIKYGKYTTFESVVTVE